MILAFLLLLGMIFGALLAMCIAYVLNPDTGTLTDEQIEAGMKAYDAEHDGGDRAHFRATRAALLAARDL